MNNIDILKQNNQSIWIDYISKEIIESGELESLINKGITGLTSNPSIFEIKTPLHLYILQIQNLLLNCQKNYF